MNAEFRELADRGCPDPGGRAAAIKSSALQEGTTDADLDFSDEALNGSSPRQCRDLGAYCGASKQQRVHGRCRARTRPCPDLLRSIALWLTIECPSYDGQDFRYQARPRPTSKIAIGVVNPTAQHGVETGRARGGDDSQGGGQTFSKGSSSSTDCALAARAFHGTNPRSTNAWSMSSGTKSSCRELACQKRGAGGRSEMGFAGTEDNR